MTMNDPAAKYVIKRPKKAAAPTASTTAAPIAVTPQTYPKARDVRGRIAEVQALLAASKDNRGSRTKERQALKSELEGLYKKLAAIKEGHKKRSISGLYSPLFEAIAARFDAEIVEQLRLDALARLEERWAKIAAKKAARQLDKTNPDHKTATPGA